MKQVLLLIPSMLVLAACANSTPSPREAEHPGVLTTVRLEPPVRVSWEEISRNDTEAVVVAKIERVNKLDMTFVMEIDLPAGVSVVEGRTRLVLLPNAEAAVVAETLVLTFEGQPPEDAVLRLDGESGAMGFHSKVPYRFGRAAPEVQSPNATGVAPVLNGRSLGPSIPLDKPGR